MLPDNMNVGSKIVRATMKHRVCVHKTLIYLVHSIKKQLLVFWIWLVYYNYIWRALNGGLGFADTQILYAHLRKLGNLLKS